MLEEASRSCGRPWTTGVATLQGKHYHGSPEGSVRKSAVPAEHCRDVGTDFDAIVCSAVYDVLAGATESEVEERIAAHRTRLVPVLGEAGAEALIQMFLRNERLTCCGTPEQIVDQLEVIQARGLAYGIFEREVVPALR